MKSTTCVCGEDIEQHTITGAGNKILLCPDGIWEFESEDEERDEDPDEFLREGLPEFNGAFNRW